MIMKTNKLKLWLPSGSLQDKTLEIFKKAWFKIKTQERSYYPQIDDEEIECIFLRSQEISKYIEKWIIDAWFCWDDWITENWSEVNSIWKLNYSKNGFNPIKLIIAVPKESRISDLLYFEWKTICTEFVNITKRYFQNKWVNVNVEFSWGATEVKVWKICDAIVDITETGKSLEANNLVIYDTILVSSVNFAYSRDIEENSWKKDKISDIFSLLNGAIEWDEKYLIKMNIEKKYLKKVVSFLPSYKKPTLMNLYISWWNAIESVINRKDIKNLIPKLKKYWAVDILISKIDIIIL